jgi:hypothetical protein
MACAKSLARITVKIFIEGHIIAPVRIVLEKMALSENYSLSAGIP